MSTQYSSSDLDHLGIVAGICRKLGLARLINQLVGSTRRHVTVGDATVALILNGLGFVSRALYLTPEFYRTKPVERLLGVEGITADDLHDDCLGDTLDRLYEAGLTEIFFAVAMHAMAVYGLVPSIGHLDSTSLSFHGDFNGQRVEHDEPTAITITHGYSKDERPDLKQMVVELICSAQGRIPMWFEALSGNSSDKASFADTVDWFVENLRERGEDEEFASLIVVADSALYSRDNIEQLDELITFVTRVPATVNAVKRLYEQADIDQMAQLAGDPGYRVQWHDSDYGGIEQRWLLVHSQAAQRRAQRGLDSKVEREANRANGALNKLSSRRFDCANDARAELTALSQTWKFHTAGESRIERHESYTRRGRPRADDVPTIKYSVSADIELDDAAIEAATQRLGLFVLATNELDNDRLDAAALVALYKGQNTTVEQGFRFLKDPKFFADALYLHKPSRVMATTMIMTLCLLVYTLAEHHLRERLRIEDETVPDQKGKPTQRLTMRRTFQMFEGIHLLVIEHSDGETRQVLNLRPVHDQILRLLGPECQLMYESPP